MDLDGKFWAQVRICAVCGKSVLVDGWRGENRWKYWVHTVELILQGHRGRCVGVQLAQRLGIKSELMQLTGDFLETFLELTVGNCMINPMGGKI
jgi:hypothetical protein